MSHPSFPAAPAQGDDSISGGFGNMIFAKPNRLPRGRAGGRRRRERRFAALTGGREVLSHPRLISPGASRLQQELCR